MKLKGLYPKTDTGIYYYQPPMVKGVRPVAISLGTTNKEEAIEEYFRVSKEAKREFSAESVRMEAARFLVEKREKGQHSERTSEETERVLEEFVNLTNNPPTSRVRTSHILAFRDRMLEAQSSPATIRSKMGRLSSFFTWAVREGLIEEHPCKKVEMPTDIPTRSERYCTKDERDLLIETLPEDRVDLQFFFWIGFFAGLRMNEIVEARRDWVDLAGGVLHVKRTETFTPKGKRNRMIRLSPRLADFLAGYLETVPGERESFLMRPEKLHGKKKRSRGKKAWRYRFDPRRAFDTHSDNHGLDWVTPHTMRHTFGTLHALAGTPLTTIAKELGDDYKTVYETYVGYTRQGNHAGATD